MKIVYMGTPEFAVAGLEILHQNGYEIVGVVTATDKPAGRGRKLQASPVKEAALRLGLRVLQPEKLKDPEWLAELKSLNADLQVVVAFRMLPEAVWDMPSKGTINLHASLLPDYRGAAPINWAVINGETQTGLTTFFIEKEIDTGKIIDQVYINIPRNWTAGQLHDAMIPIGANLILKTVQAIEANATKPVDQDITKAKHAAPKIFTETCRINWNQPAEKLYNFIRGLSPFPGAWSRIEGLNFKVFFAETTPITGLKPGEVLTENQNFWVGTADFALKLVEIQMEGRKRMNAGDFLRGYSLKENFFEAV